MRRFFFKQRYMIIKQLMLFALNIVLTKGGQSMRHFCHLPPSVTISDSTAAQTPPALCLIIFQLTGKLIEMRYLKHVKMNFPFQIHVFSLSFAESLLTGAGTNPDSSGLWGQHRLHFWVLVPKFWDGSITSLLLMLLKDQQWQHWHFNGHGGFWSNSCAQNDHFRSPAAARKMQLSFLKLMEQSLGREML